MKAIMAELLLTCHVLYTSSHTENHSLINMHVVREFYNFYLHILQPCIIKQSIILCMNV